VYIPLPPIDNGETGDNNDIVAVGEAEVGVDTLPIDRYKERFSLANPGETGDGDEGMAMGEVELGADTQPHSHWRR
jgi:hypothetical protein